MRTFEREQARRNVLVSKELADTKAALQRMTDQCAAIKAERDKFCDGARELLTKCGRLETQLAAEKRRADAAVADLTLVVCGRGEVACITCKHDDYCEQGESGCIKHREGWEWRGPQKERVEGD